MTIGRLQLDPASLRWSFDHARLADGAWWIGVLAAALLALGLAGWIAAIPLAICLAACVGAIQFASGRGDINPGVQVSLLCMALLVLGLAPGFQFIHVALLVGEIFFALVGYCLLGRLVVLAPWNRSTPLTRATIAKTFFSRPPGGGIFRPSSAQPAPRGRPSACSLNT
ncbi:MAG: hypothetical protein VYC34_04825 [Planctomycetota bacterium]|nr:hypothetical protein [Planctomycetota bacterium]